VLNRAPIAAFLGDSITQFWQDYRPIFWSGNGFLNYGVSGETSTQMLNRIALPLERKPRFLHILAGTNDVAGNGGDVSDEYVLGNIAALATASRSAGASVILGSIPPTAYPQLSERIAHLNAALRLLAREDIYVDYHRALASDDGLCDRVLIPDGVHPGTQGYEVMELTLREAAPSLFMESSK
jgi:lysophospholipase L1-like esterase